VRSGGRVAAAPEPGAGLSARLGSAYAALACGRIDAERLRDLLASHLPDGDPPVFAVDVTTWPRCDAECSRSAATTPILAPSGQPIIAGWAWQWIAQLSFDRDSWTAPVDARRLHPLADTDQTAAAQIHALLARLPAGGAVPLFVFDAGYDSAQLTLELAEAPVAVLVRLRSDRCFYADPPAPHRARLAGRGATAPSSTAPTQPPGRSQLPPWPPSTTSTAPSPWRPGAGCIQAAAPPRPRQPRAPADRARHHPLRAGRARPRQAAPAQGAVAVVGRPGQLDLDLVWRAYVRRFDLEHTIRFAKQSLGWTTPRPGHPEQADRWTWLVLSAYAQLRLARPVACDQHLPWERPRPPLRLSPVRVRRGVPQLLVRLGSPASAPKPAGCPPGRPRGRRSGPARRYPAIKKPNNKQIKAT
jgi:hypothetical protein